MFADVGPILMTLRPLPEGQSRFVWTKKSDRVGWMKARSGRVLRPRVVRFVWRSSPSGSKSSREFDAVNSSTSRPT
jgi:hypothetical protein